MSNRAIYPCTQTHPQYHKSKDVKVNWSAMLMASSKGKPGIVGCGGVIRDSNWGYSNEYFL